MAEESTPAAQASSAPEAHEGIDAPVEAVQATDAGTETTADAASTSEEPSEETVAAPAASATAADSPIEEDTSAAPSEPEPTKEPDAIQPFIDKACETIQHEVDDAELDKFLRAHIKTFREEWDAMSDTAKDAYLHMMTSQLLQRKASTTRIMLYEELKLPVPSAQTKLFESLKQSQIKPKKCIPVLLMPPNLRPTYSLKK
ncbi:MAG: hypothetical protein RIQ36_1308 [Pseudomonadota bacterium]|jgi:hypothetical protein